MRSDTLIPPLPERPPDAHKGRFGHVLIVAGSRGMTGAGVLCALSALRSGAGLVTVAAPEPLITMMAPTIPEAMHLPLTSHPQHTAEGDVPAIIAHLEKRSSVLAAGPGLGRDNGTLQAVREIVSRSPRPVVLDADALFAFKGDAAALCKTSSPLLLTPHPGEMATLLARTVPDIQRDRETAAAEAAERTGKVVVLKGPGTLVTDGERMYRNETGGPALAKGGSGDVLTGMAAALLAQGMNPFEAAVLAVNLHGIAGDLAASDLGPHSVLARDVVNFIPKAFLHRNG